LTAELPRDQIPLAGIVRSGDSGSSTRRDRCPLHHSINQERDMSRLLRGLAAGYGAKKLGGGCFSTVLIFLLLWWLLGHFNVFR
jgi:hypothetical protein